MNARSTTGATLPAAWAGGVALAIAAGALLLCAAPASAKTDWEKNERRCTQAFKNYDAVGLHELYECVALWEAYRSPSTVRQAEKLTAVQAFNFLCAHGEPDASYMAEQAIYRLKDTPRDECLQRGQGGPPTGIAAPGVDPNEQQPLQANPKPPPERQFYNPPSVSKAAHGKAIDLNRKGHKADKKGRTDVALQLYEDSVRADPRYEKAIYNAACLYCRTGQDATAIEYLRRLRDLGTDDAIDQLRSARLDPDFRAVRTRDEFRELTGYARINLCNSKGEYAEAEIERLRDGLTAAKYPIQEECTYPQDLPFPVVFFRMGPARNTAVILADLLNHPKTQLQEVNDDRDWDIAIVWGDTYAINPRTGEPKPKSYAHADPEAGLDKVRKQEDKALREPEKFARETEHRARTPERVKSRVEGNVQRVEQTKDTIERAGKTTEKVLNMGK